MNIDKLVLANLVGEVSLTGHKCQNGKMSLLYADIMKSKFHVSQP